MLKLFIGGNSQGHNDLAIKAYNGIIADGKEDSIESIEIGCGVVPMDKKQILYREAVGRSCCILAERAERVTRVICGIGVIIK